MMLLLLALIVSALIALFAIYALMLWRNRQDAFPSAQPFAAGVVDGVNCIEKPGIGLLFIPPNAHEETGLVYLPGALVEHVAYAPLCSRIACQSQCVVVLLKVPLRMSPLGGSKRIAAAMAALPNVKTWAVGGHSMGGVTAASFAASNPGAVQGVVFHASYPHTDLSCQKELRYLSVSAEHDGVITRDSAAKALNKLPADYLTSQDVKGGNHAGFGHYGPQSFPKMDGERSISLEEQQEKVAAVTTNWLLELHAKNIPSTAKVATTQQQAHVRSGGA